MSIDWQFKADMVFYMKTEPIKKETVERPVLLEVGSII